ncbi:MAG: T9SS type A sorting domain-containing protein [Crocinitomicaceae bacterium]|nr:T9SS type A sorting domain-containing protein [Crocinitomicaceae bacterium]
MPSGATVTGITVNVTSAGGANCPGWYSVTTWINNAQQGVAGCTGTASYSNFNGQAANGLVISVKGQDNDAWGDNMSIAYNVTLNYSYTVSPTYAWSPSTALSSTNTLTTTSNPTSQTTYTLNVTATNGCSASDAVVVIVDQCPALSSTAASAFSNTCTGINSSAQTLTVAGLNLQNNVLLTAPTGFGLSTSSTGPFTSSLTLTQAAGTLASTSVFVAFAPTAAISYSGNIAIESAGATTLSIPVSGTGIPSPTVSAGPDVTICYSTSTTLTGSTNATSTPATGSFNSGTVSGSGLDNTNPVVSYTFSGLPSGATVTGITVNVTSAGGANCPGWYSVTTWINNAQQGVAGCTGTASYSNFNGQAANGLVISVKGQDNDAWGDNMSIAYNVTLNYSYTVSPTYAWSPSTALSSVSSLSTTANPLTTTNYTLTLTGTNGCVSTDQVSVIIDNCPALNSTTPSAFANTCAGSNSAAQSISVAGFNLQGNAQVTAPAGFGLSTSASGPFTSSVSLSPVSGTLSVTDVFVVLSPTAATSYSGDILIQSTGAASVAIPVSGSGIFTPSIAAGPDVSICNGTSTALAGTSNATSSTGTASISSGNVTGSGLDNTNPTVSYTFSGLPAGATVTGITVNVTSAGGTNCPSWYSVSTWINNAQQGAASCAGTSTYTNFNGQAANGLVVSVKGQDNDAWGDNMSIAYNVTLTYSYPIAPTYAWTPSTGLSSTSTLSSTANPTTTTNYTLTVTGTNGCTASDNVIVTVMPLPATPVVSTPGTYCGNTVLTANNGGSGIMYFQGTTSNGTSITTPSTSESITTSGTYYFRAREGVCWGTETAAAVVINPIPNPGLIAGGNNGVCVGSSITLSNNISGGVWTSSNPNLATIDAQTGVVNAISAGSVVITYTVTNSFGCVNAATKVLQIKALPSNQILIPPATQICAGESVSLQASTASSYLWSNNVTTQTLSVTSSGTYSVIITGANGCSSNSNAVTITVIPAPTIASISGVSGLCMGAAQQYLNATPNGLWSSSNPAVLAVNPLTGLATPVSPGSATLTYHVANMPGCLNANPGTASQVIAVNALPNAQVTQNGSTTFCQGDSITLVASAGASYLWSSGQTTQSIVVNAAGTYQVAITTVNGCSANSNSVQINVNPVPNATIYPGNNIAICAGASINITTGSAVAYTWSNGQTTPSINVSSAGTFTVALTGSNGCTVTSDPIVVSVIQVPVATISTNGSTTICPGSNLTLTASPATSYLWSTGETTQSIDVSAAGSYSVSVGSGSCSASSTPVFVAYHPTPQAQITASGPTAFCQGAAVTLQANTGAGLSYLWSTGATTSSISTQSAGTYSVQITNGFGCTSAAASIQTVVNPLPTMSQISGPSTVCSNGQIQLSIPMSGGVYSSSNLNTATVGHINGLVTGLAAGSSTISYTYTNLNGCTATVDYPITILAAPLTTISASGSTAFCQGGSVELSAPSATSYLWSTGATTQSIVVSTAGNYGLTMTAANGCSASAQQVSVQVLAQPTIAAISGSSSVCVNASTQLSNATTNGLWSSSDISKATVNPLSGLVSGLAAGSVVISYQITTSNGCTANASLSMTVQSTTPTSISASGSTTLCPGASVTLTASPGTAYLWSTGATTQSITVAQAGTYQVSSLNNGCYSNSTATSVSVQPAISTALTTSGATTFCAGNNVTITAPSAGSYLWSTGATTQSIVANATGSYSVELTTNGCSATSAPLAVVVNALPTPTIAASGATTLCAGATVVLTASPASSYLWSNGANTQSITVNAAGSYGLSVTANGCSASATPSVVTMAPSPNAVITNIGSTTFCAGSSVVLNGPTPPTGSTFSYVWRLNGTPISGATAPTYTASAAGNYSLVLTNNQGCTSTSANTSVTVNALPTATITPAASTTICAGAAVTLTASAGSAYLWSNGATTQSISASTAGTYTVAVNSNGCSATSAPITVSVTALPSPTVAANGPTTICQGSNVVLTASPATTYLWSNGATTASITVNTAGNYSVLSTQNGCSATSAVTTINVTPLPTPTISTIGTTTFCQGGSVTLTAATASSYLWNNGATTQSIVVSTAGNYSVNVNNNGCAATSAPVAVVVQALPSASVTASGPLSFCQGASVTLTATPAAAYSWSNGATTQSIVVNTAGNYAVQVTNANGCVAASAASVVSVQAPPAVPQIQVVGSLSLCSGASVTLTAPAASSYLWTNGATTQSITVSTATSIGLSVSNSAGCSASAVPVVVSTLTAPTATITASGSTSICAGSNVVLTAAPASSYLWSTGATTQSISVQTAGSYTVQATQNGCSATSVPTLVEVNALPVSTVVASGPTTFCQGGSVTLSAEPATSYLWSNGATTQSITVQAPGAYTVNLSLNGCSALSTPIQVAVQSLPSINISSSGALTFCEGASVTLTADPAASYAWSNGATSQSITLATTQTVGLTVSNGVCSASATPISVQMLAAPALGSNTGAAAVCLGASAQLSNAVANGVWSSQNPSVVGIDPTSGSYTGLGAGATNLTYTVTYANGCAVSTTSPVVVNTISPVSIVANGPLSFCSGGAVQLSLPAGFAYQWSTNQTGSQILVNATGAYGAIITNAAGCSYQVSPVQVTVNTAPAVAIQASAPAICSGQSVSLTSSINAASYSWSTGSQSNSITVQQPSTYVLTVVDANGCSASSVYTLGTGITPNATIAAAGPTNFCAGASVALNANSYAGGTYLWSNGATTPSITASNSGAYTVTITSPSGCSAVSNAILVNVLSAPVASINLTGSATSCSNQLVSLAVSGTGTYLWTNNATSQSIVPTTTGNYGVTVTGSNGCTTTLAPVSVTILPAPTAQITANGPTTFCQGGSVALTASGAATYGWSNGQSGSTLSASTAGTYVLTATAANGCSDTTSIDVAVNALPANFIVASGPLSFCEGESVVLSAAAGNTYVWSNTAQSSSINVTTSGSYSATVTSPAGCSVTTNAVAVQVNQPTTSTINATGVADYILNDIMYTQSGTYTQTLTNAAGCDSTITLNLTLTVGLDEQTVVSFSVQPNPTDAVFTLKASEALYSNYVIQDAQGKVVATGALNGTSTTIDIDQVARGIYFLKVAEAAEAIRIVKN